MADEGWKKPIFIVKWMTKYFDSLMRKISGLNELLFCPTEIVTMLSLLEAALIESNRENFDYQIYRKLVLDAHAEIDKIGG